MFKWLAARYLLLVSMILLSPPHSDGSSTIATHNYQYVVNYENVLGTSLELKIVASTPLQDKVAEDVVLVEIDRESHILSSWDSHSEFSEWFRTMNRPIRVSPELFEVLSLFDEWRERTNGAVDASAEVISRAWENAVKENRIPSSEELKSAVAKVQKVHWKLDSVHGTATHTSTVPLALNSFVKSYIAGRAADAALTKPGIQGVVVNIGGDIVVRGKLREPIDICDPKSDAENGDPISHLVVRNRVVATSGDYRRGVEIAGRHYSHIVDPRTGMPADQIISSTVVAPTPADAGALATALSVLSVAESERLVATVPGAEYMLVKKNGEKITSAGWPKLELASRAHPVAVRPTATFQTLSAQSGSSLWNDNYELTISVELTLIPGSRVHRPYLAVWIEDEKHAPVRTIAVWFRKEKFLHELYSWSRAENLRSPSEDTRILNSISSATRPPGKYSFRWNGRDDFGQPVKVGKYNVMIEAAREHGTDQVMRQEIEFNGTPKQFQLAGGVEIASASLDYHKTAQ